MSSKPAKYVNPGVLSLSDQRQYAKVGMSASMGVLVLTSIMGTKRTRPWHLVSGVALVGFSLWHHSLYERD